MKNVLIYCRTENQEPIAHKTAQIIYENFFSLGQDCALTNFLNLQRILLNQHTHVHLFIESLPLTFSENLHVALAKSLGKVVLLSLLNSDQLQKNKIPNFLIKNFDAISVSQSDHLKYIRHFNGSKFILSGLPFNKQLAKTATDYQHQSFLIPIYGSLNEVRGFKQTQTTYFDGRHLAKKTAPHLLRKKWQELRTKKLISSNFHLLLSDEKINELLMDGQSLVLSNPELNNSTIIGWLNQLPTHKNLVILNDYQATGLAHHWVSGSNCIVTNTNQWQSSLDDLDFNESQKTTTLNMAQVVDPIINDLSRLHSKLLNQKSSLLTTKSAKI